MPSKIKSIISFRAPKLQAINLQCPPYKDNLAILFRVFLDTYFAGELPEVQRRFEEEVSKKVLLKSKGLSLQSSNLEEARKVVIQWKKKLQNQSQSQL